MLKKNIGIKKIGTALVKQLFEYAKIQGMWYISVTPGPCDQYNEGMELTNETQIEIYKKMKFVFPQPKSVYQLLETGVSEKDKEGILKIM